MEIKIDGQLVTGIHTEVDDVTEDTVYVTQYLYTNGGEALYMVSMEIGRKDPSAVETGITKYSEPDCDGEYMKVEGSIQWL